jgi:hypothetical protein
VTKYSTSCSASSRLLGLPSNSFLAMNAYWVRKTSNAALVSGRHDTIRSFDGINGRAVPAAPHGLS